MDEDLRRRERALAAGDDADGEAEALAVVARLRAGEEVPLDLRWRHAPWPARRVEVDPPLDLWVRRPDGARVWAGRTGGEPVDLPAHAGLWVDPGGGGAGHEPALEVLAALAGLEAGADGLVLRAQGEARGRGPGPELARLAAVVPGLARLALVGFDLSGADALAGLEGLPALEELALVHARDPAQVPAIVDMSDWGEPIHEDLPERPPRRVAPPAALAALPRLAVLELEEHALAAEDDWVGLLPRLPALRRLGLPSGARFAPGALAALLGALDLEAITLRCDDAAAFPPAQAAALRGWRRLRRLELLARDGDAACRALAGLPLDALRLPWCRAGDAGLAALGELPALRRLELHHAWLPPERAAALARLAQVRELELASPRQARDLAPLGALPRLRRLEVDLELDLRELRSPRPPGVPVAASPLARAALPGLRALALRGQVHAGQLLDALAAAPALEALHVASYGVIPAEALAVAARLPGLRALELAGLGHRFLPDGLGARPLEALAPLAARPASGPPASAPPLDVLAVLGVPDLRRAAVAGLFAPGGAPRRLLVAPLPPPPPWGPGI